MPCPIPSHPTLAKRNERTVKHALGSFRGRVHEVVGVAAGAKEVEPTTSVKKQTT